MGRTVEIGWVGGLYRFRLFSSAFEPLDLSAVTQVKLTRGSEIITESTPSSGSVRWAQSEFKTGEIVAKLTDAFVAESGDATVNITSPTYPTGVDWGTVEVGGAGEFVGGSGVFLEQCDICGKWFPIETLVRQIQVRRRSIAANYLTYSRYESSHWSCTATYLGEASMGRSRFRDVVDPEGGPSRIADGAASFWGDGLLIATNSIDASSWTTILIEGQFGVNQATTLGELNVKVGVVYDPGGVGETYYEAADLDIVGGFRAWGALAVSAIAAGHRSALQAYFRVTTETGQQVWWGERFRVQKDESTPGMTWVPTKGSALVHTEDGKMLGRTVVCPDDWERLPKQVDDYRPDFDPVPIVDDENQEL
jgi:hypothetical protein